MSLQLQLLLPLTSTPISTPQRDVREKAVLEWLSLHPNSKPIDVGRILYSIDRSIPMSSKSGNRVLYKLEKEGLMVKTFEENGTNPRWSLK